MIQGIAVPAIFMSLSLLVSGCDQARSSQMSKEAEEGGKLMAHLGCGGCHIIPGVENASGVVGPTLAGVASRIYLAGVIRNTPDNLARWIQHPQTYLPGGVMPDIPMSDENAAKIGAYLATLR